LLAGAELLVLEKARNRSIAKTANPSVTASPCHLP